MANDQSNRFDRASALYHFANNTNQYPTSEYITPVVIKWQQNDEWYPLQAETDNGKRPSAAYVMYRDLCLVDYEPDSQDQDINADGFSAYMSRIYFSDADNLSCGQTKEYYTDDRIQAPDFEANMLIKWPYSNGSLQRESSGMDGCRAFLPADNLFHGIYTKAEAVILALVDIIRDQEASLHAANTGHTCRPVPTFDATHFFRDGMSLNQIKRMVEGRVVFLGAYIDEFPDRIFTTTHGNIPGVHIHAMAYYNLVEQGPSYVKENPLFSHGVLYFFWFFASILVVKRFEINKLEAEHFNLLKLK